MMRPARAVRTRPMPRVPADAVAALAIFAASLALYVACLPPWFAFWDTGELQTVAAILGILHPPAAPAFTLLGWLAVHAWPFANPAWKVNAMCSVATALCAALLYANARGFGVARWAAALCALAFATAGVVWGQASHAEVQDVALLWRVVALTLAWRFARTGDGRAAFGAAVATGLAGATHGISVLLVPSLALVVLARPEGRRPGLLAAMAGGVALGLLPYAYLPFRSAAVAAARLDPTVALGLPAGLPFWNYDDPRTWHNFMRVVTGADFDVHSGFAGFAQLGDYGRFALALAHRLADAFGIAGAAAAILGFALLLASRRPERIAVVLAAVLPVPYTESYSELQQPERYYLLGLWCGALAIGVALERLARALREAPAVARFAPLRAPAGRTALLAAAALALAASFATAAPERGGYFAQAHDLSAPGYVDYVVANTPSDAIVVADWAYSPPLAYADYVDHAFGVRIGVTGGPHQYESHYAAWAARRPLYVVAFQSELDFGALGLEAHRVCCGGYNLFQLTLTSAGLRKYSESLPCVPKSVGRGKTSCVPVSPMVNY